MEQIFGSGDQRSVEEEALQREIELREEIQREEQELDGNGGDGVNNGQSLPEPSFFDKLGDRMRNGGKAFAAATTSKADCSTAAKFNPITIVSKLFFIVTPSIWATVNHRWFSVALYFMLNYINFIVAIIMFLTGSKWYMIALVLIFTPMTILNTMRWAFNDPEAFPDQFICSLDENTRDDLLYKIKNRTDKVIENKAKSAAGDAPKKQLIPNFLMKLIGEKTDEELGGDPTKIQSGGGSSGGTSGSYQMPSSSSSGAGRGEKQFNSTITQADMAAGMAVMGTVASAEFEGLLKYGGALVVVGLLVLVVWYLFKSSPTSDNFLDQLRIRFGIIDEDIQKDLAELSETATPTGATNSK